MTRRPSSRSCRQAQGLQMHFNDDPQLIDLHGFAASGIWAEGQQPSVRALYDWLKTRRVPAHHLPGRRLVAMIEVVAYLRKKAWHWPKDIYRPPEFSTCAPDELKLVRFSALGKLGIWHPSCIPSTRTLRGMIARGMIPYYQVARMQFFRRKEIYYCLVDHSRVEAA